MDDNLHRMREMLDQVTQAQEEIDTFFKLSPDLLVIADPRGYFVRVNPAWKEVLGYTEEELLDRSFFSFLHPNDVESTLKNLNSLTEDNGEIFEEFRNRYIAKDGTLITLDWRSIFKDGSIYAAARVVEDSS